MTTGLRREMRFWDVVLFLVAAVVGLRWIATAAAAGPSSLVIWVIAFGAFFVPLATTVIHLSARFPEEGGLYVWVRHAFGDFAGFMTGWLYWTSNLVYLPGLLYFSAANALYIGGASWQSLADSSVYFIAFSLTGLALAVGLNVVGLGVGKWLHNAGGLGTWIPVVLLVGMGAIALARFGPGALDAGGLTPDTGIGDVVFWSTIAFGFAGLETASLMSGEIVDAERTIPRAILTSGAIITGIYLLGTAAVLVALPAGEVSSLQGILQAIDATGDRVGFPGAAAAAAVLITIGNVGGVGAWLAATARLPFVAGLDRSLPPAFSRLHPRWGTPHVALIVQAIGGAIFVVLGQAGTGVQGAYDALVGIGVISYFIPFLLLFAAMIKLGRGRPVGRALAGLGLTVTAISIALAALPPEGSTRPALAVLKVVGSSAALVAVGAALVARSRAAARV
ncbi:MAG TPA: APC family permease [Kofleriaceae bacterium]|nr:APC family permease [Kofleriaceae bacterium]